MNTEGTRLVGIESRILLDPLANRLPKHCFRRGSERFGLQVLAVLRWWRR